MKILKLLNRINYLIILIFLLTSILHAEDKPVDIWNIKEDDKDANLPLLNKEKDNESLKKKIQYQNSFKCNQKKRQIL